MGMMHHVLGRPRLPGREMAQISALSLVCFIASRGGRQHGLRVNGQPLPETESNPWTKPLPLKDRIEELPSGQQTASKLRTAYLHSPQLLKLVAETPLGCYLELHGTLAGGQESWNHRRPDDGGGLRKYFLLATASTDEIAMQAAPSLLVLPSL